MAYVQVPTGRLPEGKAILLSVFLMIYCYVTWNTQRSHTPRQKSPGQVALCETWVSKPSSELGMVAVRRIWKQSSRTALVWTRVLSSMRRRQLSLQILQPRLDCVEQWSPSQPKWVLEVGQWKQACEKCIFYKFSACCGNPHMLLNFAFSDYVQKGEVKFFYLINYTLFKPHYMN